MNSNIPATPPAIRRVAVQKEGRQVHLTPIEYKLLVCLAENQNTPLSRERLIEEAWGYNTFLEDERTVDVHIRRLRKTLAKANLDQYVQTVRGHGYRFMVDTT